MPRDSIQVCYVVTVDTSLRYAEMAWASAALVRHFHPNATINLITDEASHLALQQGAKAFLDLTDRVISVPMSLDRMILRSRFLKTTMRQRVSGDFIYLDADAIPTQPIDHLLETSTPFAAALDHNRSPEETFFPPGFRDLYARLGWTPTRRYFNGGVFVVQDNPQAHQFFDEWHRRWLLCVEAGCAADQPSLNSTIASLNFPVGILPASANAMVNFFPWRFRGCQIAHYFAANRPDGTLLQHLASTLRTTGKLDLAALESSIQEGHPWAPNPEPWQLWRSRHYCRAIAGKSRQLIFGRRGKGPPAD